MQKVSKSSNDSNNGLTKTKQIVKLKQCCRQKSNNSNSLKPSWRNSTAICMYMNYMHITQGCNDIFLHVLNIFRNKAAYMLNNTYIKIIIRAFPKLAHNMVLNMQVQL